MAQLDVLHRVLDHRQGLQPQEIHLEEAGVFGHRVVKLRARHVAVLGGRDRNKIGDVIRGDDHATGMDPRVAHAAFQHAGGLQSLSFQGGLLADGLQLFHHGKAFASHLLLQRLVVEAEHLLERDVRDELGEAIRVAQRQFHDARRVSDGRLGGHGTVGDDLGDLVGAVLVNHVVDHLATPLVVEVDVDIRQAHTVRVQKPLEQQVVLDRVHVGDADAVRHRRARGRATPRPHAHAHLAGGRGEVLDNQEVARVSSAFDGLQLEVDPLPDVVRDVPVPLFRADVGQVTQVRVLAALAPVLGIVLVHELGWDVEGRQQHVPLEHVPFELVDKRRDVRDGLRNVRKLFLHLLW